MNTGFHSDTRARTYRDIGCAVHFPEHAFKHIEEVFAIDVSRHHTQCIYIGPRTMDAESVRPKGVYFTTGTIRSRLGQATGE